MLPQVFLFYFIGALRLILRHSGLWIRENPRTSSLLKVSIQH